VVCADINDYSEALQRAQGNRVRRYNVLTSPVGYFGEDPYLLIHERDSVTIVVAVVVKRPHRTALPVLCLSLPYWESEVRPRLFAPRFVWSAKSVGI
jgi:hypothetical protein